MRIRHLGLLAAVVSVASCKGKPSVSNEMPSASASGATSAAALDPWDPADENFRGCAGG